jgi:polyisoprenyl-teichoic acid--peptidoglycan teichoic acid transferase
VFDVSLIDPAYPDYDQMRQIVQDAIAPPAAEAPADGAPSASTSSPAAPTTAAPTTEQEPVADVGDACAYDRAQAEEALAAGEPRTKDG